VGPSKHYQEGGYGQTGVSVSPECKYDFERMLLSARANSTHYLQAMDLQVWGDEMAFYYVQERK